MFEAMPNGLRFVTERIAGYYGFGGKADAPKSDTANSGSRQSRVFWEGVCQ
jgi:hypothetical protein